MADHRREAGRRSRPAGWTSTERQAAFREEEPLEAAVRPAPVVLGRRVVDLDAVRRGEHAPAGRRRRGGARARPGRDRRRARAPACRARRRSYSSSTGSSSTGPYRSASGFSMSMSMPTYSRRSARRGQVRLLAAADVEDAEAAEVAAARCASASQPAREVVARRVGDRALLRLPDQLAGPAVGPRNLLTEHGRAPSLAAARTQKPRVSQRSASSGMPATSPSALSTPMTSTSQTSATRPRRRPRAAAGARAGRG